jgi:hypothetical protein
MPMQRREFIAAVAAAATLPLGAWAQQATIPAIGYLSFGTPAAEVASVRAFLQGLAAAKAATWQSNSAGQITRNGCRRSRQNSSNAKWL